MLVLPGCGTATVSPAAPPATPRASFSAAVAAPTASAAPTPSPAPTPLVLDDVSTFDLRPLPGGYVAFTPGEPYLHLMCASTYLSLMRGGSTPPLTLALRWPGFRSGPATFQADVGLAEWDLGSVYAGTVTVTISDIPGTHRLDIAGSLHPSTAVSPTTGRSLPRTVTLHMVATCR